MTQIRSRYLRAVSDKSRPLLIADTAGVGIPDNFFAADDADDADFGTGTGYRFTPDEPDVPDTKLVVLVASTSGDPRTGLLGIWLIRMCFQVTITKIMTWNVIPGISGICGMNMYPKCSCLDLRHLRHLRQETKSHTKRPVLNIRQMAQIYADASSRSWKGNPGRSYPVST